MLQHIQPRQDGAARKARNLHVGLATCETEILEAQKLRYRVFADEMGARLATRTPGVDRDIYDPFCEHLIVRDEAAGRIVGTYRILSPAAARKVGGYYSENEFDLTRLQHLRGRMVEIGRSCIDADYRSGAVIALLWSGLARYMQENGYDHLIGCAKSTLRRLNITSFRAIRYPSPACAATSTPRRRRWSRATCARGHGSAGSRPGTPTSTPRTCPS